MSDVFLLPGGALFLRRCLWRTNQAQEFTSVFCPLTTLEEGEITVLILLLKSPGLETLRDVPNRVIFQRCHGLSWTLDLTASSLSSVLLL